MAAPVFLSRDEEQALAIRWRDHKDEKAMHAMVEAHAPLVKGVARKFARFGIAAEDLIQEGTIGLMQAANRFEPERNLRFSTYARWWVQAMITELILRQSTIVCPSRSSRKKGLFFAGNRWSEISMEAPLESGATLADTLESDEPRPDEATERSVDGERLTARLESALSTLNTREQAIIRARWLAEDGATLDSLGNRLGISKERVRQLETRAMQGLRKAMGVPA